MLILCGLGRFELAEAVATGTRCGARDTPSVKPRNRCPRQPSPRLGQCRFRRGQRLFELLAKCRELLLHLRDFSSQFGYFAFEMGEGIVAC